MVMTMAMAGIGKPKCMIYLPHPTPSLSREEKGGTGLTHQRFRGPPLAREASA